MIELRLVERVVPVTDDPRRTRRRRYRVADNFLAFWLGVIEPYKAEIERGLGRSILPVIQRSLDDFMGPRWEEAFREHLRRLAGAGELGPEIVALGPFWRDQPAVEIDAVALAGRARTPVLAGEAKWARSVDAAKVRRSLEQKTSALGDRKESLRFAVAAREEVRSGDDVLSVTEREIFG